MSGPQIIHAQSGGQIAEPVAKPENPRAFPSSAIDDAFGGMSLRDSFAGQALSGMLASEAGVDPYSPEWAAERAYLIADAMLAEREKGGAQ